MLTTGRKAQGHSAADAVARTACTMHRARLWSAFFSAFILCACIAGCVNGWEGQGILSEVPPSRSNRMLEAGRITDGRVPREGSPWNDSLSAVGRAPDAFVDFDLGEKTRIRAAWIQADHDDRYALGTSDDGRKYRAIWVVPTVPNGGLRARHTDELDVETRYVRLAPIEGDGVYGVSELILFSEKPAVWPPAVPREQWAPPNAQLRRRIAYAAFALVALTLLASRRMSRSVLAALVAPALILSFTVAHGVLTAWPIDIVTESAFRGVAAAVGAVAIARLLVSRWPAHRPIVFGVLGAMALVSVASFFHFGHRQFYDHRNARPSFIHNYDMRVYFPAAKYFSELGFDGLYVGSIAALLADEPAVNRDRLNEVPLRDLKTHRIVRVGEVASQIRGIRDRFSADRWQAFIRDMGYFREAMGIHDYLRTLLDHGGNATPLWLANARLLFGKLEASNEVLFATALLDPLLLALSFIAIAITFGAPSAVVSLLIFGANDFHVGGNTNWVGATLRHDWLAALAFAVCALKARRWAIGGALLALSGFLRAFPAFALLGILATGAWWLFDRRRNDGRWPALRVLMTERRDLVRSLGGASVATAILFWFSSILLGPNAWWAWLHKVQVLSRDAHPNHLGLRTLFSRDEATSIRMSAERALDLDWQAGQAAAFESRAAMFYIVALVATALVVWACRRQSLERGALLGLSLFLVWLYPANYYLHFVFLLPLLAPAPRRFRDFEPTSSVCFVWLCLCGLCTLQYTGVVQPYVDEHYYRSTLLTFIALSLIVLAANEDVARWVSRWIRKTGAASPA